MKKFDLTTTKGMEVARQFISDPFGYILDFAKGIFDFDNKNVQSQHEVAEQLIKQAKESGAEEIEIKLNKEAGVKMFVPIEGANIDVKVGGKNDMYVKVKFKNQ